MNVDVLKEIADLSVKVNDKLNQSEALRAPRFLGLLFTALDPDTGKRGVKFILGARRCIVSRKMYHAGKDAPHKWVVGIMLDREQDRVDAYGHRSFDEGELDPLHLQSR